MLQAYFVKLDFHSLRKAELEHCALSEMSKMRIKMHPSARCPKFLESQFIWISFILFSTSNICLLSKFVNSSDTYNANWSPASFGLSKTSMHFAINVWFCSVGYTRLRLALFSTRDLLESEFNKSFCGSSSCSFSPWMTDCGSESFNVEVFLALFSTCSTKRIFPWMARSSHKRRHFFGHSFFTFLCQFSPMLYS